MADENTEKFHISNNEKTGKIWNEHVEKIFTFFLVVLILKKVIKESTGLVEL